MNKNFMKAMGFSKEVKSVELGICPFCKVKVDTNKFRDDKSRREFLISGLCDECQKEIFGKGGGE